MNQGLYEQAVDHVRQLAGSSHTRAVGALLLQVIERYRNELEDASPERVAALQVQIKQCRALLSVINGEPSADAIV